MKVGYTLDNRISIQTVMAGRNTGATLVCKVLKGKVRTKPHNLLQP